MSSVEEAICASCGRKVNVRPCPFCGGNIMNFGRDIIEPPIKTRDIVTRTVQGTRERKNRWAVFALIVISAFDLFVIISNSNISNLTIHLFISITIFILGYFALVRSQNLLLITMKRMFREDESTKNINTVRRRCNLCNAWFDENPCPKCGALDSRKIGTVNETEAIKEAIRAVRRNNFIKINMVGGIFLILMIVLQGYFTYSNGGIINLTNSSLMALILFIPSYYVFLKVYFTDTEAFQ